MRPWVLAPSPNHYKETMASIKFCVFHCTSGRNVKSTINHFQDSRSKKSAHVVIDKNGARYKCVEFALPAWHAGGAAYGDISDVNLVSFGIELVNSGPLFFEEGSFHNIWQEEIPQSEVEFVCDMNGRSVRPYETFPLSQLESLVDSVVEMFTLCRRQMDGAFRFVTHRELSPLKVHDPSCLFPFKLVTKEIALRLPT